METCGSGGVEGREASGKDWERDGQGEKERLRDFARVRRAAVGFGLVGWL